MFIALCKITEEAKDKVLLYAERDGAVGSWNTKAQALEYFERGYREAMDRRDGTWQASACVNWLFFKYSIVEVADEAAVFAIAVDPPQLARARHVSGFMSGFLTRDEVSFDLWEKGDKPRLIPLTEDACP